MKEILKTKDGSTLYEVCVQENSDKVMIVFPGGAYISLADYEGETVAEEFADKGYSTYVMMYRVTTTGKQRMEELLESSHEAVEKVRKAHPEANIILTGFSAGGNLIANYGNKYHDVEALVLCYPAVDWIMTHEVLSQDTGIEAINARLKRMREASDISLFGTAEPTEDMFKEVSPILTISDKTPPTFIWHTAEDHLVPVEGSLNYFKRMKETGVTAELHIYSKGEHGAGLGKGTPIETWPELADRFISTL